MSNSTTLGTLSCVANQGYDNVIIAANAVGYYTVAVLAAFGQLFLTAIEFIYLGCLSFAQTQALPFYNNKALPYLYNDFLPVLRFFLTELLTLCKALLEYGVNAIADLISSLHAVSFIPAKAIDYCQPKVFFVGVLLTSIMLLMLVPTIRTCVNNKTNAFRRSVHHFIAPYFPSLAIWNPTHGPRTVPDYLYTDGLTPAQTQVPPHKGCHTGEQLTRHVVPITNVRVNLIPTDAEAHAGLHPSTAIQTSVPTRPPVVHAITADIQRAVDNGNTPAQATANLIARVTHHMVHPTRPNLVPLRPAAGASLATVVRTHPGHKELAVALNTVLRRPAVKNKLAALYGVAFDQHVRIAEAEHQGRSNKRRRLNQIHGNAAVDMVWISVPH